MKRMCVNVAIELWQRISEISIGKQITKEVVMVKLMEKGLTQAKIDGETFRLLRELIPNPDKVVISW